MAKKKVEIPLRAAGDVPSGDVNVTYNGVRIAGLSESTSATLKTEMNVVEHDIELEYTKPAGETVGNVLTVSNNTEHEFSIDFSAPPTVIMNENYGVLSSIPSGTTNAIVLSCSRSGSYFVKISLLAESDIYDITVNGNAVSYSGLDQAYSYFGGGSPNPINGQTYNVVINNKK